MIYIDLGNSEFVSLDDIVAIIDSNAAIEDESNHKFILDYETNGKSIFTTKSKQIKSYVFCDSDLEGKRIYKTSFTSSRLKDRIAYLEEEV